MLRITTEQKAGKVVLVVEGRLAGQGVASLKGCWTDLRGASPKTKFQIDLCGVMFIDDGGKVLLREIHRQGGDLVAEGCLNHWIVEEIAGERRSKGEKPKKEQRRGSHIIFYLLWLGLSFAAGQARAQSRVEPPVAGAGQNPQLLKLTLDQAVALALKRNPTARIAVLVAEQSEKEREIARAELLPQASARISDQAQKVNLRAQFGGKTPFPGFPQTLGPYQVFSAGPSVTAPIFDLSLWRRYQASQSGVEASRAGSLSTREQVILLVVSQYIGTIRSVADVQASNSRVELAQALYDQAADLQKEGVGTGIDTLRAHVELQNEKQRLIQAAADRDRSLYGLSRLLDVEPGQEVELSDSLGFFDTPQPEAPAAIEQALSSRQEWRSLEAQRRAAEFQKKATGESRFPSLRFDGTYNYVGTSSSTTLPTYTYQASVNFPLFTGGRIHAEMARAELEIRKLDEQKVDLRNQIALEVKSALLGLNSARNEVQVASLGLELSRQEVEQARDRFKAGVANNIEVIQAQDSLARASDNQIQALYRFNQARADLARATGQMEKLYAK